MNDAQREKVSEIICNELLEQVRAFSEPKEIDRDRENEQNVITVQLVDKKKSEDISLN